MSCSPETSARVRIMLATSSKKDFSLSLTPDGPALPWSASQTRIGVSSRRPVSPEIFLGEHKSRRGTARTVGR